jgi:hypothetical protein
VRVSAEGAGSRRLALTCAVDDARRCAQPQQNLSAVTREQWATIRKHLEGGDGGELVVGRRGTRPKFCPAFSSAALVVNVFGPFVDGAAMTLPGVGPFDTSTMRFEAKRTAGTKGYPPNLELVLEPRAGEWVFVESKCLEYLRRHTTAFSFAFVQRANLAKTPLATRRSTRRRVSRSATCSSPSDGRGGRWRVSARRDGRALDRAHSSRPMGSHGHAATPLGNAR